MAEVWKDIPSTEGKWQVSDRGGVRYWTPAKRRMYHGRPCISLPVGDGTYQYVAVRDLVAAAFLGEPSGPAEVVNISGDVGDNRVENLEWRGTGPSEVPLPGDFGDFLEDFLSGR